MSSETFHYFLFSQKDIPLSPKKLFACSKSKKVQIEMNAEDESENWSSISFRKVKKKNSFLSIEKLEKDDDVLMETFEEMEETIERLERPVKALAWIQDYLKNFKVAYWIELETPLEDELWDVYGNISSYISEHAEIGLIYFSNFAEFYNNDHRYIIWDEDSLRDGVHSVATLDKKNKWVNYEIDVDDSKQLEAFYKEDLKFIKSL